MSKPYQCNTCGASFEAPVVQKPNAWRVCPHCYSPDFGYKGVDGSGCVMLFMLVIALIAAWFIF